MNNNVCLGIDTGSSGVRVGLFDAAGTCLGTAVREFVRHMENPGEYVVDPYELVEDTFSCIREVLKTSQIDPERVVGISGCSCGSRYIAIDEQGNYPFGIIDVADIRTYSRIANVYGKVASAGISPEEYTYMVSTTPPALYSLKEVLEETQPEKMKTVAKWSTCQYSVLMHALCGRRVDPEGFAMQTGLYNPSEHRYEPKLCEIFDASPDDIVDLNYRGEFLGTLTDEAAARTGLSPKTKVYGGLQDTIAQVYAANAQDPEEVLVALGTWTVTIRSIKEPIHDPRCMICSAAEKEWLVMKVIGGGGETVKWLKNTLCSHFAEAAAEKGISIYDYMNERAEQSPIGSNGMFCNPNVMGDIENPFMKATYLNISSANTLDDFIRAVYEGIAYELKKNFEIIDGATKVKTKRVHVCGGVAKSKVMMQILADVLNVEIITVDIPAELVGIKGAALIAGVGAGIYKDIAEASQNTVKKILLCKPIAENVTRYQKLYDTYTEANEKLNSQVYTKHLM